MAPMSVISVAMEDETLEIIEDRRGPLSRGAFIRKLVEDSIERGARVVVDVGREGARKTQG